MKKRELKKRLKWAATYRERVENACASLGHPRTEWRDRREELGYAFWTRDSCPCGQSGSQGRNFRPDLPLSEDRVR